MHFYHYFEIAYIKYIIYGIYTGFLEISSIIQKHYAFLPQFLKFSINTMNFYRIFFKIVGKNAYSISNILKFSVRL